MKNSILKFLEMVQQDCINNGVEIRFHAKDEIKLSRKISIAGYWDEDSMQLNVAVYCDDWLTVLAHEYGHFCQWKENKFIDKDTTDAYYYFDEWILGNKNLSKKRLDKYCELIQKCELDCEKRALKFIKRFNLYKSDKLYIQKANSYVLGYEAAKLTRKWFKVAPSRIKKVFDSMPKTFVKSLKPSKEQLEILLETCF